MFQPMMFIWELDGIIVPVFAYILQLVNLYCFLALHLALEILKTILGYQWLHLLMQTLLSEFAKPVALGVFLIEFLQIFELL